MTKFIERLSLERVAVGEVPACNVIDLNAYRERVEWLRSGWDQPPALMIRRGDALESVEGASLAAAARCGRESVDALVFAPCSEREASAFSELVATLEADCEPVAEGLMRLRNGERLPFLEAVFSAIAA